ncbi:MAG: NADH-quinone oxidoreductase subunit J [Dehalococcoidia bacterium]
MLSVEQVVFYIIAAIAVGTALGVVLAQDIVHAALFLVGTLMLTAGVYVLLSAEFLSLVQILVYGGGVAILVMFAVMITRVRDLRQPLDGAQKPFGVVAALFLGVVLALMIAWTKWGEEAPADITPVVALDAGGQRLFEGTRAIGHGLFTTYAVPFEIASLVLLIALVGAIILARGEEEDLT